MNCEEIKNYVYRDDAKLFYRIKGSKKDNKPVMVFVHGDDSNSTVWKCQQNFFCRHYQTIAIDMRGFGHSTKTGLLTIENHRDDLKFLLNELDLLENQIYLIGWSIGGLVVQSYTLTYPNDVKKLVLVDTGAQIVNSADYIYGRTIAEELEIVATIALDFPKYITEGSQKAIPETCKGIEKIRNEIAHQIKKTGKEIALKQTIEGALFSSVSLLSTISIETLIFVGLIDGVINPKSSVFLNLNIPNSRLIEFPEAGHAPFLTFTKKFNEYLLEFVNDVKQPCELCE